MNSSTESENTINQLQQENELLQLQLHQSQEELEYYFYLCQDYEAKCQELLGASDLYISSATQRPDQLKAGNSKLFVEKLPKNLAKILKRTAAVKKSILRHSEFFDEKWYLESYPDVAKSHRDPVAHYLSHGAKEGRNPGPQFDTQWYLATYRDVAEKDVNPLLHYIQFGQHEGRWPSQRAVQPPPNPFTIERQVSNKQHDLISSIVQKRDELVQARDFQMNLAAERLQHIEQLKTAKAELEQRVLELQDSLVTLNQTKDEQIKLAEERQQRILQLEAQLVDMQARQVMLNEEMIKAEAQIDFIKDLLLEERVI